ncbi:hypothetical protein HOLleu_24476 [Holothuria leucospilota]|uniref:Uncharacterized protein n=1 Tax=Holothuria leucospilota TaxID=206669 RepID=A0A9Q1BWX8_HOLLE|nr:hypothetical protein HOLleu_24476 [Holothuria leucospilota]
MMGITLSFWILKVMTVANLLFEDSTVALIDVGNRNTYDTWVSKEYLEGIKTQDLEECSSSDSGSTTIEMTLFALMLGLLTAHVFGGVA